MKPTHLQTPRTLAEGHFARGYTTEPVGRRQSKLGQRVRDALLAVAIGAVIAAALVAWWSA